MLQLIGRLKCRETKKGERFLKERNIDFHFVDLARKELSPGELKNICRFIDPEDLIDRNSGFYIKKGYEYMDYDAMEELLENQEMIKTPVLRSDKWAVAGFSEEDFKKVLERTEK